MSKEEVMQAFRILAMGRPNHVFVEQLADALAQSFAASVPVKAEVSANVVTDAEVTAKRRKKAD